MIYKLQIYTLIYDTFSDYFNNLFVIKDNDADRLKFEPLSGLPATSAAR